MNQTRNWAAEFRRWCEANPQDFSTTLKFVENRSQCFRVYLEGISRNYFFEVDLRSVSVWINRNGRRYDWKGDIDLPQQIARSEQGWFCKACQENQRLRFYRTPERLFYYHTLQPFVRRVNHLYADRMNLWISYYDSDGIREARLERTESAQRAQNDSTTSWRVARIPLAAK